MNFIFIHFFRSQDAYYTDKQNSEHIKRIEAAYSGFETETDPEQKFELMVQIITDLKHKDLPGKVISIEFALFLQVILLNIKLYYIISFRKNW